MSPSTLLVIFLVVFLVIVIVLVFPFLSWAAASARGQGGGQVGISPQLSLVSRVVSMTFYQFTS